MKFDTTIIGGGLSGLVCGLRLQKAGRNCVIVSAGQNAMHFSSGYFDFLDRTPDGKAVSVLADAIESLPDCHPYSKIGKVKLTGYMEEVQPFFSGCGVRLNGKIRRLSMEESPDSEHRRISGLQYGIHSRITRG